MEFPLHALDQECAYKSAAALDDAVIARSGTAIGTAGTMDAVNGKRHLVIARPCGEPRNAPSSTVPVAVDGAGGSLLN